MRAGALFTHLYGYIITIVKLKKNNTMLQLKKYTGMLKAMLLKIVKRQGAAMHLSTGPVSIYKMLKKFTALWTCC